LGVLKNNIIEFSPKLPQAKQEAIDYIGFGALDKCVFYWDTNQTSWWPEGKEFLTLATDQDETNGDWTTIFNDKELGNGGHFVLSALTAGSFANKFELQSDDKIVGQLLKNLRTMLGPDVPPPVKYVITRWGHDPLAFGSYSWTAVGGKEATKKKRRTLAAKVGKQLFWAGEATDEDWYGTTVGAYKSGIRAAQEIL